MTAVDRVFRVYEPHELADDSYPFAWRELPHEWLVDWGSSVGESVVPPGRPFGIKDVVRHEADYRCLRCGHPYVVGKSGSYEHAERPGTYLQVSEPRALFDRLPDAQLAVQHGRGIHWSPCDERCTHGGPVRLVFTDGRRGAPVDEPKTPVGEFLADVDRAEIAGVEAAWRILTVHHLNERKHDCRWWNLAALCQRCHLYIQRKVQIERVYPWEHSEWFRPFAAGWYAYAYLGQELTRGEVDERLDELLALERTA